MPLAEDVAFQLRTEPNGAFVDRLLNEPEATEVVGPSGALGQVEIEAFWGKPGDLRVIVATDDGGLRGLALLATGFIISPDGCSSRVATTPSGGSLCSLWNGPRAGAVPT